MIEDRVSGTRRGVMAGWAAMAGAGLIPSRVFAQAGKERLVVAMPSSPATLEPIRENSNVLFRVGYNIFDNLVAVDFKNGGKLVPGLATAWTRPSPTEMEFTLREGVRFHDDSVMTAEDVVFSFGPERVSGKDAPGYALTRPFLGTIVKVEATGPLKVRFTTEKPDPLLEQRLAAWTGQIISRKAYLAAANFDAWQLAPVGTGPYKVKEFRNGDRVVLTAHDAYFGGRPPAREILFRVVPELASRLAALATGEADIATELSVDQFETVKRMADREVVGGPIMNIRVLVFDKTNPVLADARVRRALGLAIDRKAIVDSLYEGLTRVPRGLQHESWGDLFLADRPMPVFDPAAARALLKEAGYSGQPITYRVLNNYYTLQIQTAQALIEMWKAVGLDVRLEVKENWTQILAPEGRGIRDWSNTLFWNDPVGVLARLYGPGTAPQVATKEWANEDFNAACVVMRESLDPAARLAAHRAAQDIYTTIDPPGTVLHDLAMFYGKKKSVGWTPYPIEYMDFRAANMV